MPKTNGQTEILPTDLDTDSKLNVILEALTELKEDFTERFEELNEKLANLNLVRDELDFFEEN